jgi:predicted lipoprotein with Yx(FWY)xxD motif
MALHRIGSALAIGALLLAACSAGGAATPTPVASTVTLTLGSRNTPSNGLILVGPNGRALYVHQGDGATSSTCTGSCLQAWPALTIAPGGTVTAVPPVPGTFATFVRSDDGSTQVTYNGLPLYYWTGDTKPGDVTGHGVNGFAVVSLPGSGPAETPCQSSCSATPKASARY